MEKQVDPQQEVLAALQPLFAANGTGAKQLLVHAIHECRALTWRTGKKTRPGQDGPGNKIEADTVLAQGLAPEDLVSQAIERTITGTRPWNQTKYPNIINHLKWVIKSLANNLATSGDNSTLQPLPEDAEGQEIDLEQEETTNAAGAGLQLPEVRLLLDTKGEDTVDLLNKALEAIGDDDELITLFQHLMDDKRSAEIAKLMRLSDKDCYRLSQKFRRRMERMFGSRAP